MAKNLGFRVRNADVNLLTLAGSDASPEPIRTEDFDVCWIDCGIPAEALAKLKNYQRLSQYPGI